MSQHDPAYPLGNVSVFTTDTTKLVPATGRQLRKYGMFTGCLWKPCFSHNANMLLLDQLKVTSVAKLLAASKQITTTVRTGNFQKIFLMYVAVKCAISVIDQSLACSCCASWGICRQVFDQGENQPLCSCRFASYTKVQLPTFCLTCFSLFAILINSLQKHRETLASAVTAALASTVTSCCPRKSMRRAMSVLSRLGSTCKRWWKGNLCSSHGRTVVHGLECQQ
jgi:hypothetical protein